MKFLLDVNVLIAWGWADHVNHDRTINWIASQKNNLATKFYTSPIPVVGFVRVSVQRSGGRISVVQASEVLSGMLQTLGSAHAFLPDDVQGTDWPTWCTTASTTTDAHLLLLAQRHKLQMATLDSGIAGAYLLPTAKQING